MEVCNCHYSIPAESNKQSYITKYHLHQSYQFEGKKNTQTDCSIYSHSIQSTGDIVYGHKWTIFLYIVFLLRSKSVPHPYHLGGYIPVLSREAPWIGSRSPISICTGTKTFKPTITINKHQQSLNRLYPPVIWHTYWKWSFIVSFPIETGDFP